MSLYVESGGILDLAKSHMLSGTPDNLFWKGYGYAAAIAWIYFLMMVLVMLYSSVWYRYGNGGAHDEKIKENL